MPGLRRNPLRYQPRRPADSGGLSGIDGMNPRILFVNHTGELGGAELTLLPIAHRYRDRCAVLLLKDGPLRERLTALGVTVMLLPGGDGMLGVKRQGGALSTLASVPAVLNTV